MSTSFHNKPIVNNGLVFSLDGGNNKFPVTIPYDINGLSAWYDANDVPSIITDGSGLVESWHDKSGNGFDWVQPIGANKPSYNATGFGVNSKAYINFDGVDEFLESSISFDFDNPITLFFVIKWTTTSGVRALWSDFASSVGSAKYQSFLLSGQQGIWQGSTLNGFTMDTNETITRLKFDGVNSEIQRNNETKVVGNAGTTNNISDLMRLGFIGYSGYGAFDISEMLLFKNISDADTLKLQEYLNQKYTIY